MPRILTAIALVASSLAANQPARASEAIDHASDEAFIAIRFASRNQYIGNFTDLLTGIGQLAVDQMVPELESGLNDFAFLRNDPDVIDPAAPVCGVLYPIKEGGVPVAMFIKSKNDAELYRSLTGAKEGEKVDIEKLDNGFTKVSRGKNSFRTYFVAKRGELTVYTRNENVMKKLAAALKPKRSFRDALGKDATKEFLAGDISVSFNVSTGVKAFKSDMEMGRNFVKEQIKNIPESNLGVPSPKSLKEILTAAIDFVFQGIYDAEVAVGRANFSSAGAQGSAYITFKDGSQTDGIMKFNPVGNLGNIELLQSEEPVYIASNLQFGKWTNKIIEATLGLADNNEANVEAIANNFKSIAASFAFSNKNHDGLLSATIEDTKDVAAYRAAWNAILGTLKDSEIAPFISQSTTLKKGAETVAGKVVDLVTVDFKVKNDTAEGIATTQVLQFLFGKPQLESRLLAVENLLVQVTSNDKSQTEKLLKSGEGILGLEDSYAKTRDQLHERANMIVLANGARFVQDALQLALKTPLGPFLKNAPIRFDLKPPKSYAGVSVSMTPGKLAVKAFVPVSQPRDITKIFVPGL
ncbi:MAG: hypothetical protein O3A00_24895 [Planctomycetota bacterium]|nr:hypothetical protein [Planctomycetota bacterium]